MPSNREESRHHPQQRGRDEDQLEPASPHASPPPANLEDALGTVLRTRAGMVRGRHKHVHQARLGGRCQVPWTDMRT